MLLLKQSVFAYEGMFSSLPQIKDKAGDIFLEPVEVYEKTVCEALSLTGATVQPSSLEAVHHLKRPNCAIVKFQSRKLRNEVFSKKRILRNKSKELVDLGFNDELYINESLSKENQHLFYQCRMLKKAKKIHATWFANGVINMIYGVNDSITKIYHPSDIERVLNIANIDEYLKSIE